jgi:hypothetical protein
MPPHPFTWGQKQIKFPKRCVLLEQQTSDKVQKLSSPECNTPPPWEFRIVFWLSVISQILLCQLSALPSNTQHLLTCFSNKSFIRDSYCYVFNSLRKLSVDLVIAKSTCLHNCPARSREHHLVLKNRYCKVIWYCLPETSLRVRHV